MIDKKTLALSAIAVVTILGVGSQVLKTPTVDAATETTTAVAQQANAPQNGSFDPAKGGHVANGKTEELLTGDNATKATASAKSAVPGGTIERVETDADGGGVYEAHMVKSDGPHVTVLMDSNFKVTSIQDGPSGPPKQQ